MAPVTQRGPSMRLMAGRLTQRTLSDCSFCGTNRASTTADTVHLVGPAIPPITRLRAPVIWIDDALCRAARCRRVALGQRRVEAFVIADPAVHVQANRISRIVGLGASRPY